MVTLEFKQIAY